VLDYYIHILMFSHILNNPNNFVIDNDYHIIPFGSRCTSAIACKFANLRKFSLPFDWTIPLFPNKIKQVIENNFDEFIPDVHKNIFNNKYGFHLAHFNSDASTGIEEYKRRIERFNNIMSQPKKIYFVYINEDYLYDPNYRKEDFNDNIFNEMLELEKFIKDKYININYNILYFNFIEHNVSANSNIINIVLQTPRFYRIIKHSQINAFRIYCGKILTELFSTKMALKHSKIIYTNMYKD